MRPFSNAFMRPFKIPHIRGNSNHIWNTFSPRWSRRYLRSCIITLVPIQNFYLMQYFDKFCKSIRIRRFWTRRALHLLKGLYTLERLLKQPDVEKHIFVTVCTLHWEKKIIVWQVKFFFEVTNSAKYSCAVRVDKYDFFLGDIPSYIQGEIYFIFFLFSEILYYEYCCLTPSVS